jgi:hypothetical protein
MQKKPPTIISSPRFSFSHWAALPDDTQTELVKNNLAFTAPDFYIELLAGHLPFSMYKQEKTLFRALDVQTNQKRFAFPRLLTDVLLFGSRGSFPQNFNLICLQSKEIGKQFPVLSVVQYKTQQYEPDGDDLILDRYVERCADTTISHVGLLQLMLSSDGWFAESEEQSDFAVALGTFAAGLNCEEGVTLNETWRFALDLEIGAIPYTNWDAQLNFAISMKPFMRKVVEHFCAKVNPDPAACAEYALRLVPEHPAEPTITRPFAPFSF